ncbi:Fur family transcriptional regulator [Desulfallas thermosapovorans]|uniref:Fur family ferric uptake transcriptional regulator n=1 Tax=Desulfallas thermosapovorans DSM 6562 TaxID=1121431 RepID=A0A5S4ZSM4_9FIRM|nr:Fur family transcriptional regulator [Desulfallas thermosapovorans]TYO95939.1 Fur family ferric uptake transcriptional regulator [Desulfallas thermosapovorans DSM 6562]
MRGMIGEVEEILRAHDYKMTPKREHVLCVLLENKKRHLSAEEVYNLVKQRVPDVGLATVYRTLELFSNFDIIRSTDFGDGRKRYEFGTGSNDGHRHHHLICVECGKIIEMNEDLLEDLEERVTSAYDFTISDHELKIFGKCRDCMGQKNK